MGSIHHKVYLVLTALLQVIDSLSNLSVRIPEYLQKGETADLTCSYNLGGDSLYSVKWYKGRHEFFRYMPHEVPPMKIFPVKGMKINVTASDQTRVVIEDVKTTFTGTYLCEVTVTPSYFALMQYANMTVIDFPDSGPTIKSERQQYQVGEKAHLTCMAQQSSPPSQLAWYINGEPANEAYTRSIPVRDGVQALELIFPVTSNHFEKNKNLVTLKCLASISNFYWMSDEVQLLQEKPKYASVMENGGTSSDNSPVAKSSASAAASSDGLTGADLVSSSSTSSAFQVRPWLTFYGLIVTSKATRDLLSFFHSHFTRVDSLRP